MRARGQTPDAYSFGIVAARCVRAGDVAAAATLYDEACEELGAPSVELCRTLLRGAAKERASALAVRVHDDMVASGLPMGDAEWTCVLRALRVGVRPAWDRRDDGDAGESGLLGAAPEADCARLLAAAPATDRTAPLLIAHYGAAGDVDAAEDVLLRAPPTSDATHTAWMSIFTARHGPRGAERAFRAFSSMREAGAKPSVQTYNVLLNATAAMVSRPPEERVALAERTMAELRASQTGPPDIVTYNTLTKVFLHCKRMDLALGVLGDVLADPFVQPDAVTVGSLLQHSAKLRELGHLPRLIQLAEERDIRVDEPVWWRVVKACLRDGEVELALSCVQASHKQCA